MMTMCWKSIVLAVLSVGVCLTAGGGAVADDSAAEKSRPNIVYLLADDLGYRDVSWRGGEIQTPHLDALANSGARLESFYVQPVCSPTRAALLTGRYPFRYGLQVGVVRPWAQYGLPLEERLLPQALKSAGYATAICGKWHLGAYQRAYLPTARGFDRQYGHYNGALDYFTHIRDGGFDWHRDDQVCRDEGYTTELVGREAVSMIEEFSGKQPFFLYVPFNAPHGPYQPPTNPRLAYENLKGNRRNFARMVTAVDDEVGRIVAALDRHGLREKTLILFSSDNGGVGPGKIADNTPLRAGKGTLYEGGVRRRVRLLARTHSVGDNSRTAAHGRLVPHAAEAGGSIRRTAAAPRWAGHLAGADHGCEVSPRRDRLQPDADLGSPQAGRLETGPQRQPRDRRRRRVRRPRRKERGALQSQRGSAGTVQCRRPASGDRGGPAAAD